MKGKTVLRSATLLFLISLQQLSADYSGSGQASDDYASYNIKTIGLVVIGKWKGSEAKVAPTTIAGAVKMRLRDLGYEVNDVRDRKHLKSVQKTVDAILTIKYEAMIAGYTEYTREGVPGLYKHTNRYIRGTAEMVTTKRVSKKKKVVFKASGVTGSQTKDAGDGEHVMLSDPVTEFMSIIRDIPPVPKAAKQPKEQDQKKDEGEKKDKGKE